MANKLYYLFKSKTISKQKFKRIMESDKRYGWTEYNPIEHKDIKLLDYVYVDGEYIVDKSTYKYKTRLKNVVDIESDNYSISNKYNLMINLKKNNINAKHLINYIYINITVNTQKIINDVNTFYNGYKNDVVIIFKPIYGTQGAKISIYNNKKSLLRKIKELRYKYLVKSKKMMTRQGFIKKFNSDIEWVAQEYITNPLLYRGYKFHIRAYIIYYKNMKRNGFVCGEEFNFIVIARDKYRPADYNNPRIHDTHSYYDPDKLLINYTALYKQYSTTQIHKINKQIEYIGYKILDIISAKCYNESADCYNIYGADYIVCDDYTVKIIECNHYPIITERNIPLLKYIKSIIIDKKFK